MNPIILIIDTVCDYYNIDKELLKERNRQRHIALTRQTIFHLTKEFKLRIKLDEIGEEVAEQKHDSVLYGRKVVDNLLETDKVYSEEYKEIHKRIKNFKEVPKNIALIYRLNSILLSDDMSSEIEKLIKELEDE